MLSEVRGTQLQVNRSNARILLTNELPDFFPIDGIENAVGHLMLTRNKN